MSQDFISPEQGRRHRMRCGMRILLALAVLSFQDAGARFAVAQDTAPRTATPVPAPPPAAPGATKGDQSAPTRDRPAAAVQPSTSEAICLLVESAAQAHGLSIGLHVGGTFASAPSAGGWPQFYIEEHHSLVHTMQNQVASLILEGVFEAFPKLKVVMIEGGVAWVPTLGWRLDAHWAKMRDEVPQVKRPPSEYMRTNIWYATQPVEEPEQPDDLRQVFEWIGWDRMVYSSDYPHWDFDDPHLAFRFQMTEDEKRMLYRDNALSVYNFR